MGSCQAPHDYRPIKIHHFWVTLSVDQTFKFEKFEVMPFTYKHLFLKSKRTGLAPVFLGPTAIYYNKQKSVYSEIVHDVASNTPSLAEKGKRCTQPWQRSWATQLD